MRQRQLNSLLLGLALLVAGPGCLAQSQETLEAALAPALERAGQLPRLYSLLISHQGDLVVEEYYNGHDAEDIANVKSVSKSIVSALVGAAIDRGYLESVNQPIGDFFPQLADQPAKAAITLEDLLTMQSGLETTSNRNYGRWVLSDNWIDFALDQPLEHPPGEVMQYSTGSTHLLSAILTRATGQSTLAFARDVLAGPLGFYLNGWPTDPQGVYFGGNDMVLTPRQMLRIGELFSNEGQYNGRQVLPADWVAASLADHAVSPRDFGRRTYGYNWWIRDMAGYRATYAWGYGGQFIMLVDELDLIIVTTSSSQPGNDRRRHTRAMYNLVEDDIIAGIAHVHQ